MENQQNSNGTGLQLINPEGNLVRTVIGENAQSIAEILMGNILRVQNDPNYIPQAKEIRDQAREMINLARVEVDMFREVAKFKKG